MRNCEVKRTKRSGKIGENDAVAVHAVSGKASFESQPRNRLSFQDYVVSSFASGKLVHSAPNRPQSPFATSHSPTSRLSTSY